MPQHREHLERSRHNIRLAESLDIAAYPDWVVTAYFYAALHLVDSLLDARDGISPPCHGIRSGLVRGKWYLRAVQYEYRDLKNHSENARYNLITFGAGKIEREVIPPYRAVEAHVVQQLKDIGKY